MKYEPDRVCRRDRVAMLRATKKTPTVAIRKPSHDPLPASPTTTAMPRAGVSVGPMLATDWPTQSTSPRALVRRCGRSAALLWDIPRSTLPIPVRPRHAAREAPPIVLPAEPGTSQSPALTACRDRHG